MLSANEIVLIIIILTTLALIAFSHIAVELIALLILLVLNFSGIIDSGQALSGFSSTIVITLIGLFVITHALEETGVIQWVATKLNRIGGKSEVRLITLFMAAGAMLSLVMNNVAAGAVLLPAVVQVAQVSKVRASKLLIPMSFGTLIGGMATYLTTANIVMSELLRDRGLPGLNMLDFIPTGGLIVIASVVYMVLVGRRLLPERESITQTTTRENLQQTYKLDERMWSVRVSPKSRLANTRLSESKIGEELGLSVLAISHGRQK
ncbi:MAG TPA: SLC13 family permease, partial [Aggregatilineales bacterium]|nr:SLC13 family permease [Aggregatilineales bacterium]